jgi:hypothetical protein
MYKTYDNREEFRKIFFEHLNRTSWKNLSPIGESKRYIKKLSNVIKKIPEFLHR